MESDVSGEIYNVGSTEHVSINELAHRVIDLAGSSSATEYVAYEDVYGIGIEDMLHRVPSIAKTEAAIGWRPERLLDDILADVLEFERGRAESG